jgi:hypothetical protein
MFNNSHKDKYLKYKTKYLNLKNLLNQQKGGMGYSTYYWNQHPDFSDFNKTLLAKVLLSTTSGIDTQYDDYAPMLNNLLKKTDGVIDLNFINNFARHIYYDLNGDNFGLDDSYNWTHGSKTKYNIVKRVIQEHGNTTILFLESPDGSKKVLKIFNNINVDITKIKDYLSLEITHITDKYEMAFQTNYNRISSEAFESINFNMEKDLITTNNGEDKLYLSCRNNDAINDYIINLILQNIKKTPDPDADVDDFIPAHASTLNFVKYDNLFVTQVNGIYRYCILMEHMDGTLFDDNHLAKELREVNKYDTIFKILNKIDSDLNILKVKKYLFTHTDMKCQNVFYKNTESSISPYLADFDKSSISFHNIRFYNDIRTNASYAKSFMTDPMSFTSSFLKDYYTIKKKEERSKIYNLSSDVLIYRLSRVGRHILPKIGIENIETEQSYMRYNYTPYYTSFDMCSLLLSLFSTKKIKTLPPVENNLYKLFIKYINEDYLQILLTTYFNIKISYPGNFGELLTEILVKSEKEIGECFKHNFITDVNPPYINKLYLSNANKICLSIPFCPIVMQVSLPLKLTQFQNNTVETIKLYKKYETDLSSDIQERLNHKNFKIEYNYDYSLSARGIIKPPDIIVATNRYSMTTGLVSGVYEYDKIEEKDIKKVYEFITSTNNN